MHKAAQLPKLLMFFEKYYQLKCNNINSPYTNFLTPFSSKEFPMKRYRCDLLIHYVSLQ